MRGRLCARRAISIACGHRIRWFFTVGALTYLLHKPDVYIVLLSAIGIDETRLGQALAEETAWMQLRENLISRINDVASFWMNCWGLALLLVFFTSPATFPFNCPLAAPLDPDDMVVDWRTPFPYAFASFLFLAWSFLVSKMWLLVLVNFPASSLRVSVYPLLSYLLI
jgi:hypothetical protein